MILIRAQQVCLSYFKRLLFFDIFQDGNLESTSPFCTKKNTSKSFFLYIYIISCLSNLHPWGMGCINIRLTTRRILFCFVNGNESSRKKKDTPVNKKIERAKKKKRNFLSNLVVVLMNSGLGLLSNFQTTFFKKGGVGLVLFWILLPPGPNRAE